jgi:16S rRNA (uracil1498-N3)-methyltransferase
VITLLIEPRRLAAGDEVGDGAAASRLPTLRIEGDAYRHLFRARRLAAGERLRLVDGEGGARWGEVLQVGRAAAAVALREPAAANEPALRLELLVPTLRPERASWLVEKATEVGAASITFHNSERAPRAFGGGTLARLRRVAAAAVEQCHRSCCPRIAGPFPLADLLPSAPSQDAAAQAGAARAGAGQAGREGAGAAPTGAARLWLLDPAAPVTGFPRPAAGWAPDAADSPHSERLLVGPEGGWTPAELAALHAAGCQGISLGPRLLRIETAAVAAAVLLLLSGQ